MQAARTCGLLICAQALKPISASKEVFFAPKFPPVYLSFCLCGSGCGSNEKTAANGACRRSTFFAL